MELTQILGISITAAAVGIFLYRIIVKKEKFYDQNGDFEK
jgi:hypothetical protein